MLRLQSYAEEIRLSAKQKLFLTILIAHPNGIDRHLLAKLLWPNRPLKNARHSISQAIHSIRTTIPSIEIVSDGDSISLQGNVRWDVRVVLNACEKGHVRKAIDAYTGEFLEGLQESGNNFEDWRSSIQTKVSRALHSTIAAEITDLSLRGNLKAANVILSAVKRKIGEEFCEDVVPIALRNAVTNHNSAFNSGELPFVGRRAELCTLHRNLIGSIRGLSISAVVGQPGIGKSALCSSFVRGAVASGACAMHSRAYPANRNFGYRSLLTALGTLPEARNEMALVEEPWRTAVQSLQEESASRKPQLGDDVERQEFIFEALARVLLRLARNRTLILWIDDIQWADPSTISFLEYLRARRPNLPVCIVLSLRDPGIRDFDINNLLELADSVIHLGHLSRREIGAITSHLPSDRRLKITRELWRLTAGHPYLISEIFYTIPGKPENWSVKGIREVASTSISQIIASKIEGLSAAAKSLLISLAVFNKPVSAKVVKKVVALKRPDFMQALDELIERKLIRDEKKKLACGHDLIREAVYLRLSCTQKQLAHLHCANALERCSATSREIIDHLLLARARKRAYVAALRASSESRKVGAYKETDYYLSVVGHACRNEPKRVIVAWRRALNAFESGHFASARRHVAVLERIPNASRKFVARVCELQLQIDRLAGRKTPAELMTAASALATMTCDKELIDIHCQALRSRMHVIIATGRPTAEVEEVLNSFLNVTEKYPATAASLVALCGAAQLHLWLGAPEAAEILINTAVSCLDDSRHSPLVKNEVLVNAALMKYFTGQLYEAKELCWRALAAADQAFSMRKRTVALINLSAILLELGDYINAAAVLDEIIHRCPSSESVPELAIANANYALLHLDRGEMDLAEQRARECLTLAQRIEHCRTTAIPLAVLGICALNKGSLAEAKKCRDEILRINDDSLVDDVLPIEQFLRRLAELEREYEKAAARLESRIANSSRYNICCRIGLNLELARVLLHTDPKRAHALATEQIQLATRASAFMLINEADAIIERARRRLDNRGVA